MKSIMLAGTGSGCGKTTATLALMAGFKKRGIAVQGYKVGPDYIDPIWHECITGRPSKNLDAYFMEENILRYTFDSGKTQADVGIIEGVMGFYDGLKGGYEASSAHVSAILDVPVILVVDAKGMSLSLCALINGYRQFHPDVKIAGVLLNRIQKGQYELCRKQIQEYCHVEVFGYMEEQPSVAISSRHLGLHTNAKNDLLPYLLAAGKNIDFEKIDTVCKKWVYSAQRPFDNAKKQQVHIAVARDDAFLFYYHDNLTLLEEMGACLHFFSPLEDESLPDSLHGIYIGGGYPEEYGRELSENRRLKKALREKAAAGCPIYAECGGLMYLTESIQDMAGDIWPMTGVLKGHSLMEKKLGPFGYVEIEAVKDTILAKTGGRIKGHEFHYSRSVVEERAGLAISKGEKKWPSGYMKKNVLAMYPHLHFYANTHWAQNFINQCARFSH